MLKKIFTVIIILGVLGFVVWYKLKPYVPSPTKIIFQQSPTVQETNGRTNILLLGTGGENHDGPNLTDTIIFASINVKQKNINLISIPRDLWITDVRSGEGGKINEAYAEGQDNNQHKGLVLAKAMVGKILNQPIHYAFRIDFGGFVKAVDMLDGLDVQVDNTLDDYAYPIEGKENDPCDLSDDTIASLSAQIASGSATEADSFPCRYKHLHVDKGNQHMDGTVALQFVRSRHAMGKEGSDFARSRRQQRVIEAFRQKLFSLGTIFNPAKTTGLLDILKASIDMDIPEEDYIPFVKVAQEMKEAKIKSTVLDFGDKNEERPGLLTQPPISAAYRFGSVLIPRAGGNDYSEIQKYAACELTTGNCQLSDTIGEIITPTAKPTIKIQK